MANEPFKRSLGLAALVALGLNSVIGTGIFLTPGPVAAHLGGWGVLAFAAGGLLCLAIALCFAEMAALVPETGGAYAYALATFGPLTGFLVGWVIWLSAVMGWASVAVPLAEELARLWHPELQRLLVVVIVVGLGALNWRGAQVGAWSNLSLALLKMGPLLLFLGWCLPRLRPPAFEARPGSDWLTGGLLILYTFSGFEEIPVPAGETDDPQRTIPRALALVLGIATVVYMVAQAAVTSLGGAGSDDALRQVTGGTPWLLFLLTAASLFCMASVNASIAFTGPRSLWALTHARVAWLSHLHPVFRTPSRAILVTVAATLAMALTNGFERLAALSVLASLLQYVPTVLAVLVWRRRAPELRPAFRVPGGPVIPLVALLVCALLLLTSDRASLLGALEALGLGLVLYAVRTSASLPAPSPPESPP